MVQRAAWWMCCGIGFDTLIGDFLSEVVTADQSRIEISRFGGREAGYLELDLQVLTEVVGSRCEVLWVIDRRSCKARHEPTL